MTSNNTKDHCMISPYALYHIRKIQRLDKNKLARSIGVNCEDISQWEEGYIFSDKLNQIPEKYVQELSNILHCSAERLSGKVEIYCISPYNLHKIRVKHNQNQNALANNIGVSRQAVCQWEIGHESPENINKILPKNFNALIEVFHCTPEYLKGDVDDPRQIIRHSQIETVIGLDPLKPTPYLQEHVKNLTTEQSLSLISLLPYYQNFDHEQLFFIQTIVKSLAGIKLEQKILPFFPGEDVFLNYFSDVYSTLALMRRYLMENCIDPDSVSFREGMLKTLHDFEFNGLKADYKYLFHELSEKVQTENNAFPNSLNQVKQIEEYLRSSKNFADPQITGYMSILFNSLKEDFSKDSQRILHLNEPSFLPAK